MANRGEISRSTVKEWEDATKGKKLPEKVSHAFARGTADALALFGFKTAAEEIRLKIPNREFHGWDAAFRSENDKNSKHADCGGGDADDLAKMLDQLNDPTSAAHQMSSRDPLDRNVAWGSPSNLAAGDTANRLSDMGQPTSIGTVF